MPRFKVRLAYVGTRYAGWQIQDKPSPPPTVQGELEKVLTRVTGQLVRVHGAGRTDSGVHAEGQVAHTDIPESKAHLDWQRIFNTSLPQDISVLAVERVPDSFHARFDALHKSYAYLFWQERRFMPPPLRPFAWDCGRLDEAAMREALPHLMGRHDFKTLQNAGTPIEDTTRTVLDLRLESAPHMPPEWREHALLLTVTADGFLKQMVRNMAGLLSYCGRGKLAPSAVPALLLSGDRRAAPPTAPACGLTLRNVSYPHENAL